MDDTMTDLPLVGQPDTQGMLASCINRMRVQAVIKRGIHTDVHPQCINLYLYGDENGDGAPHVVPKIQGMINASTAQIARNVPNIVLKASTVGDGGPGALTTEGKPVTLNSETVGEFLQSAVDTVLHRSNFKQFWRKMAFYGKLYGWQDALADANHDQHRLDLRIFPALQWYKPSDVEEIEEMSFFGVDVPVDAEWAKKKYPALRDKIDEAAQRAVYTAPSASGYSDIYMSQTYAYPVVTLSTFWIRNREMPMTDQEAVQLGLIELRSVPMENPNAQPVEGESQPSSTRDVSGNDAGNVPPASGDTGESGTEPTGIPPDAPSNTGLPAEPPMREAMFHKQSGEEITSVHPNWPLKYVISKSVQLLGEVVSDEVCPSADFPVVTNINIRIPNQPYGQSDCIRVRTQQLDTNTMNDSVIRHGQWWKGPVSLWPASIQEVLPENFRNIGVQPNTNYFIPDDALRTLLELYGNRNIIGQFEPPALPPHLMEILNYLGSAFDIVGSRPEVSQGNAPTANSSGELAKVLLDASQMQNDYASVGLEDMAKRLGEIALDYILREWQVEDFLRFNRTYDAPTVAAILELAESIEWEINVDAAVAKQQREAAIRADYAAGLIDEETALDALGYDSAQIMQRKQMAQQQQMAAAAVAGAGSDSRQLQGAKTPASSQPQGSFKLAGG